MRKLRKLNPEEVVKEEVLNPDAIGEDLDNAKVLSDEELQEKDVPTPDFEEEKDEDTEINEEDFDLDAIGEVLNNVDSKPVTKKPSTNKSKTKTTTPSTTIKVALPNTMSLEEFKAKKSINMADLSSFIFTYLVDHQPATKKNVEEMVNLIFKDILPYHMDNEHPIRLGDLRIGYSKVSGRVYENSKLSENLEQLGQFDTYVKPHTVARFKREINKVSYRGKLSPTKKTFTLAEADENGKLKLTKKTIKL